MPKKMSFVLQAAQALLIILLMMVLILSRCALDVVVAGARLIDKFATEVLGSYLVYW